MISPRAPFENAVMDWLENQAKYIKPRTLRDYIQYRRALIEFFGATPLGDITLEKVRGFQQWRSKEHKGPGPESKYRQAAGNVRIKTEISCVLKPLLREAGLWNQIASRKFQHLPVSFAGSGRSLTPKDVEALLQIAFSNKRWSTCANVLKLMFNTGCGFGEVRHLRRRDVDLTEQTITIGWEGAKNRARIRTIPLNRDAADAIEALLRRWQKLGGSSPDDFLLPFRVDIGDRTPNFTRPMTSIHQGWMAIRAAAIPILGEKIRKFRIYDCRVTAITWVLSNGNVSLLTAERLFGHVSIQMQRRYFKPEMDTIREAVALLENKNPLGSYPVLGEAEGRIA
jgi:integrase